MAFRTDFLLFARKVWAGELTDGNEPCVSDEVYADRLRYSTRADTLRHTLSREGRNRIGTVWDTVSTALRQAVSQD